MNLGRKGEFREMNVAEEEVDFSEGKEFCSKGGDDVSEGVVDVSS